jgi:cytochrome c6
MLSFTRILSIAAIVGLLSAAAHAQNNGSALFQSNCQACHGADGRANTPIGKSLKVANLHDPAVVKLSDQQIANVIRSGKSPMPAFGSRLTSPQIEALVAYVRTLQKK